MSANTPKDIRKIEQEQFYNYVGSKPVNLWKQRKQLQSQLKKIETTLIEQAPVKVGDVLLGVKPPHSSQYLFVADIYLKDGTYSFGLIQISLINEFADENVSIYTSPLYCVWHGLDLASYDSYTKIGYIKKDKFIHYDIPTELGKIR